MRTVDDWAKELVTAGVDAERAVVGAKWAQDVGRRQADSAKDLGRDLDDIVRSELIKSGMSPERADAIRAKTHRDRKWLAASNAVLPAKLLSDKRAVEDTLRKACGEVAKQAERVALALARIVVEKTPDQAAAALRDGSMRKLSSAISAAIPMSPAVFQTVQSDHPSGKGTPYVWDEVSAVVDDLVDAIAQGGSTERVPAAAKAVNLIGLEAGTWAATLQRRRGRPTKPGVDGAVALKAKGLNSAQIAMMLDRHGLSLDGYTPAEAARQAEKTRRRRTGTK